MIFVILSITLSLFIIYIIRKSFFSVKVLNLPPGPPSLPLIGSLFHFIRESKSPLEAFKKLSIKYGPIYRLTLGSKETVVLTRYDDIKELGQNEDLINRNDDGWVAYRHKGLFYGIIFSKDKYWQDTRRYSHRILKDNGFGKNKKMERILLESINEFTEFLSTKTLDEIRGSFEFTDEFNLLFLSFTYTIILGKRLSISDPILRKLTHMSEEIVNSQSMGGVICQLYPWLAENFPYLTGYDKFMKSCDKFRGAVEEIIDEEVKSKKIMEESESFTGSFLQMIEKSKKTELPYDTIYKRDNLNGILQDLIIAGNDTQANTMKFAMRFLIQYPKIQKKCQEEVDRTIGVEKDVELSDLNGLKYIQATLNEILRISTVAPIVPRQASRNTKLGKFDIQKGTIIFPVFLHSNHDESIWDRPHEFRPERFLNSYGELVNLDKIQTFGTGKRSCIGEIVARQSLILLLATLFQKFDFEHDPVDGIPTSKNIETASLSPAPYKIIIKKRFTK